MRPTLDAALRGAFTGREIREAYVATPLAIRALWAEHPSETEGDGWLARALVGGERKLYSVPDWVADLASDPFVPSIEINPWKSPGAWTLHTAGYERVIWVEELERACPGAADTDLPLTPAQARSGTDGDRLELDNAQDDTDALRVTRPGESIALDAAQLRALATWATGATKTSAAPGTTPPAGSVTPDQYGNLALNFCSPYPEESLSTCVPFRWTHVHPCICSPAPLQP